MRWREILCHTPPGIISRRGQAVTKRRKRGQLTSITHGASSHRPTAYINKADWFEAIDGWRTENARQSRSLKGSH